MKSGNQEQDGNSTTNLHCRNQNHIINEGRGGASSEVRKMKKSRKKSFGVRNPGCNGSNKARETPSSSTKLRCI
jgi:hypothetical protein